MHKYIHKLIGCNTAVRGLTDIYAQSQRHTAPKGEYGYTTKTPACPCHNLCNAFNRLVLCCS